MTSTNAKKGSAAYYNVDVISISDQTSAALSPSEASSLGISDALSFDGYDADVLADAAATALANMDNKTGWQSIASLA